VAVVEELEALDLGVEVVEDREPSRGWTRGPC
jgi:hypothetical protein